MSNDTMLNYLIMNDVNYEGYEIIHTRDDKYLIVNWYEYFDTLADAKNAIDDFIRKNNKTNNVIKENSDMKENKRLFIKKAQESLNEVKSDFMHIDLSWEQFLLLKSAIAGAISETVAKNDESRFNKLAELEREIDTQSGYNKGPAKSVETVSNEKIENRRMHENKYHELNDKWVLTFRPDVEPDEEMLAGCKDEDREWGFESEYDAERNTWRIKGAKETLDKYVKELDLKDNEYELKSIDEQESLNEDDKDKKIIFFGKGHENRELDEASKKLPYGVLAWQLNEIISAMNDEGAYYESGWLYIWPDGATRQDAIDSFSTKEDYEELEDLFKRVYKRYHRSGLYKVSDKVLERAHQWDKKLGLSQIVDVNDKNQKQSGFDDELEMKIGEVLKNAGIDEDSYEIDEEYTYKNLYFYDNTTAKKALKALKDSNEFIEVKGYVEQFPRDGHSSIEVLVTIPEE